MNQYDGRRRTILMSGLHISAYYISADHVNNVCTSTFSLDWKHPGASRGLLVLLCIVSLPFSYCIPGILPTTRQAYWGFAMHEEMALLSSYDTKITTGPRRFCVDLLPTSSLVCALISVEFSACECLLQEVQSN